MSCEDCERVQEENKSGNDCAYLRVGNSNLLIGACDKHFNELKKKLGYENDTVYRVNK